MLTKKCPFCGGSSYSSSDRDRWRCPYCEEDLTLVPSRAAGGDRSGLINTDVPVNPPPVSGKDRTQPDETE